jgi:hypothetical protein
VHERFTAESAYPPRVPPTLRIFQGDTAMTIARGQLTDVSVIRWYHAPDQNAQPEESALGASLLSIGNSGEPVLAASWLPSSASISAE